MSIFKTIKDAQDRVPVKKHGLVEKQEQKVQRSPTPPLSTIEELDENETPSSPSPRR